MKFLTLTKAQLAQVDAINAQSPHCQLAAIELADGRLGLPVNLLSATGPGEAFEHGKDFLKKLSQEEATPKLETTTET